MKGKRNPGGQLQSKSLALPLVLVVIWSFSLSACQLLEPVSGVPPTPTLIVTQGIPTPSLTPATPPTRQATLASLTPAPTQTPISPKTVTPSAVTQLYGEAWSGVIYSQSSRVYMNNGSPVNTCKTDWETNVSFRVDPNNNISGVATGKFLDVSCSPQPVSVEEQSLQTQSFFYDVTGQQNGETLSLQLEVKSSDPNDSADLGGISLLFDNGACPLKLTPLHIPIVEPGVAEAALHQQGMMTGCGASASDRLMDNSSVNFKLLFDCTNIPPDQKNSPAAKVCSQSF